MIFAIVGLGIMGGSIAKAIRSSADTNDKIYALDKNNESLYAALTSGIIDKAFTPSETNKMLSEADMLFVCLYPQATLEFFKQHKNDYKNGAIITDISGVKHELAVNMEEIRPANAHMILGHPMAGGEKEGFAASKGEYFLNHNYILIKPKDGYEDEAAVEKLRTIITKMGFTRITEVDADTHDNKIGFTSQLCHVVASAMVESAGDPEITSFGGGSFEDLTRIAMINAPLWTELFLANREKLVAHIENFEAQLDNLKKLIETQDANGLQSLLADVRSKRIQMQKN
ncbi:prephenate dehydrogenase [Treponema bryantii]|uniref:Prephenate dehydrogenase n=1 Tax=Treponema bryantii TaxID=163 RepID=A0A1I3MXQ0_9SPIR|nr:prephenate dehydrogenase [Treponema bryantii]SFJ01741.1 prephenate dehydrogenase [Treponema bryantii]